MATLFLFFFWWGVSVFCGPWLLGDPKTVTTRHKSVAAEETGHWIDETGDRPTRQTLDQGRRRRKKGKNGKHFLTGPAQAQILSPPHPHRNTILRSTGFARVCLSLLPFGRFIYSSAALLYCQRRTHFFFFLIIKHSKSIRRKVDRIFSVQFNLFAGHPTCFAI